MCHSTDAGRALALLPTESRIIRVNEHYPGRWSKPLSSGRALNRHHPFTSEIFLKKPNLGKQTRKQTESIMGTSGKLCTLGRKGQSRSLLFPHAFYV